MELTLLEAGAEVEELICQFLAREAGAGADASLARLSAPRFPTQRLLWLALAAAAEPQRIRTGRLAATRILHLSPRQEGQVEAAAQSAAAAEPGWPLIRQPLTVDRGSDGLAVALLAAQSAALLSLVVPVLAQGGQIPMGRMGGLACEAGAGAEVVAATHLWQIGAGAQAATVVFSAPEVAGLLVLHWLAGMVPMATWLFVGKEEEEEVAPPPVPVFREVMAVCRAVVAGAAARVGILLPTEATALAANFVSGGASNACTHH